MFWTSIAAKRERQFYFIQYFFSESQCLEVIKQERSESARIVIVRLHFLTCCEHTPRDSSVGIATRYGLDGPDIETRWRRDFPYPSAHSASCTMGPESSPGVKRLGPGADHPPPCSAEFAIVLELYLPFPSVPAQICHGVTFTLPIIDNIYYLYN